MYLLLRLVYIVLFFGLNQAVASDDPNNAPEPIEPLTQSYHHSLIKSIVIQADSPQKQNIQRWLEAIARIPKGEQTLKAIAQTDHILTIKHTSAARLSAGRTIAPMTNDLINGIGADITIIFDGDIPDTGSHRVYDGANQPIEFTAVQNLYHELAHAMHQMRGTWRYFASEKQAIEEENIFRIQQADQNGIEPKLRFRKSGFLVEPLAPTHIGYTLPSLSH